MKDLFQIIGVIMCAAILSISPSTISADITDLDHIYSETYQHNLPRKTLEGYYKGTEFNNKTPYSPEEQENVKQDIRDLWERMMGKNPVDALNGRKIAYITAGAPGSGKTTLLEQHRAKHPFRIAYADPDAVSLKTGMPLTYGKERREAEEIYAEGTLERMQAWKDLYNKWRCASNASCQTILANLIRIGKSFYYGTTATSPYVSKFFDLLKQKGFTIHLLHITAPDEVRVASNKERDKSFVQVTDEDIVNKGIDFPQRINDYLKYADTLDLYYRGKAHGDATLAATLTKVADGKTFRMEVLDPAAYDEIQKVHNLACEKLGKPELKWAETVDKAITP